MEWAPEEYTRYYIVQALFRLMNEYEYDRISVTDIAGKAGVGRATFYRYFKRKEDIIIYYFERIKNNFVFSQHIYPRCREDYVKLVKEILYLFKENKEYLRLLRKAKLDGIYLDYLNKRFVEKFQSEFSDKSEYMPYIYSGMLFNLSMKWLDDDCRQDMTELAELVVDAIYK